MTSHLRIFILSASIIWSCLSFGQAGPKMMLDGTVIPFDEAYLIPASESARQSVIAEIHKIIDSALSKGIQHIGDLDIHKLRQEINTVHLFIVDKRVSAVGTGRFTIRVGSVYMSDTKSVYLNQSILNEAGRLPSMLIHEFIGALGYDDENYQISSILLSEKGPLIADAMNRNGIAIGRKLIETPHNEVVDYTNKGILEKGGTTVIGGGGDEILLSAKIFMIDNFDDWTRIALPELLKTRQFQDAMEKYHVSAKQLLNPKEQMKYLTYFTKISFEAFTARQGVLQGPVESTDDLENIIGIFNNKDNPRFVRLSREHWDRPFLSLSLDQSRFSLMSIVHMQLMISYLGRK